MKKIENFGGWIMDNWFFSVPVMMLAFWIPIVLLTPKHVSLSEKEFKCVETAPVGIEAECVTFTKRVK